MSKIKYIVGYGDRRNIKDLLGKTLTSINITHDSEGNDTIIFECDDGEKYVMYHDQECGENVYIEDICGNLAELIGYPLTMAEDISNEFDDPEKDHANDWGNCHTWTWYKLANRKGYVTIRWYGESNGYYSEDVDFAIVKEEVLTDD